MTAVDLPLHGFLDVAALFRIIIERGQRAGLFEAAQAGPGLPDRFGRKRRRHDLDLQPQIGQLAHRGLADLKVVIPNRGVIGGHAALYGKISPGAVGVEDNPVLVHDGNVGGK